MFHSQVVVVAESKVQRNIGQIFLCFSTVTGSNNVEFDVKEKVLLAADTEATFSSRRTFKKNNDTFVIYTIRIELIQHMIIICFPHLFHVFLLLWLKCKKGFVLQTPTYPTLYV